MPEKVNFYKKIKFMCCTSKDEDIYEIFGRSKGHHKPSEFSMEVLLHNPSQQERSEAHSHHGESDYASVKKEEHGIEDTVLEQTTLH